MEEITRLIQPELLATIPILCAVGWFFKKATPINNKYIPILITVAAMFMALTYTMANEGINSNALLKGVWQGILCAAAAVYTHQIYKQAKEE